MIEPLKAPERVDLFKYLINKDDGEHWYAGAQLLALDHYTNDDFYIINSQMIGDYQGDCYAVIYLRDQDVVVVWRDYFGSCSGCDGLEDENGYEYIKSTLTEGNTMQFKRVEDAVKYMKTLDDYLWKDFNVNLFNPDWEA